MTNMFGLRVPQGALKTILRRAAKRGYVHRSQGIYVRDPDAIHGIGFAKVRDETLRRHEALVSQLTAFCAEQYGISWSRQDASEALLAYVQDYARPVLSAAVDGHPIPPPGQHVKHAMFLVNAFAMHLYRGDPGGFEFLETIVKGSMLTNALLFSDLAGATQRFKKVDAYLDTRFLLRALSLAGESQKIACVEVIDLLYRQNVNLKVFEHTVDEIQGVLDAAARALRTGRTLRRGFGETLEHLIDAGRHASDVEFIISRLPRLLHELRVEIVGRPPHTIPLGLNEGRLEEMLQHEVGYLSDEARRRDVDSLTSIHRLRWGRLERQIEHCGAIFITTNVAMARAASRFFREEYEGVTVPLCLVDHVMATIAWLKSPMALPEFPRHQMIANFYAATRPPDTLWKAYLEEIDRLQQQGTISEDDYNLLRFSTQARSALMNITFGSIDAFSEGTVAEVLEAARSAARAETEAALREETEKRVAAETAVAAERDRASLRSATQLSRVRGFSTLVGKSLARGVVATGFVLVAIAVYLALPRPLGALPGDWWGFVVPGLLVGLWILSVANMVFGTTIQSFARRLELQIAARLERILKRLIVL